MMWFGKENALVQCMLATVSMGFYVGLSLKKFETFVINKLWIPFAATLEEVNLKDIFL